ncbi:MAG: hypothetical protein ABIH34_01565 [Nanoarchaeota archaeon]
MVLTAQDVAIIHNWKKDRKINFPTKWFERLELTKAINRMNKLVNHRTLWEKNVVDQHKVKEAIKEEKHWTDDEVKFLEDFERIGRFVMAMGHVFAANVGGIQEILENKAKRDHLLPNEVILKEERTEKQIAQIFVSDMAALEQMANVDLRAIKKT